MSGQPRNTSLSQPDPRSALATSSAEMPAASSPRTAAPTAPSRQGRRRPPPSTERLAGRKRSQRGNCRAGLPRVAELHVEPLAADAGLQVDLRPLPQSRSPSPITAIRSASRSASSRYCVVSSKSRRPTTRRSIEFHAASGAAGRARSSVRRGRPPGGRATSAAPWSIVGASRPSTLCTNRPAGLVEIESGRQLLGALRPTRAAGGTAARRARGS